MKITEGIVWEKNSEGQWIKTIDNWPANRRGARIVGDDDPPFGQYGKNEAIRMIEEWITKGPLSSDHYRLAIIPGREMAPEDKEKLVQYNSKRKQNEAKVLNLSPSNLISAEEQ